MSFYTDEQLSMLLSSAAVIEKYQCDVYDDCICCHIFDDNSTFLYNTAYSFFGDTPDKLLRYLERKGLA